MDQFFKIVEIASCILTLCTLGTLFIRPIRERVFNLKKSKAGELCLLRSEILKIYYKNLDARKIRQYEFENSIMLYEAYKALGGNSFIDEVVREIREWTIVS